MDAHIDQLLHKLVDGLVVPGLTVLGERMKVYLDPPVEHELEQRSPRRLDGATRHTGVAHVKPWLGFCPVQHAFGPLGR